MFMLLLTNNILNTDNGKTHCGIHRQKRDMKVHCDPFHTETDVHQNSDITVQAGC